MNAFITPGLRDAYICTTEDLRQAFDACHIEASEPCGAFTVHSGQDEAGCVFFAIESNEGAAHAFIRTPFRAEQWAAAQEK